MPSRRRISGCSGACASTAPSACSAGASAPSRINRAAASSACLCAGARPAVRVARSVGCSGRGQDTGMGHLAGWKPRMVRLPRRPPRREQVTQAGASLLACVLRPRRAGLESKPAPMQRLSHLGDLEAESIQILREVFACFRRPVMLYSIGKDSTVLLHLLRKACRPAPPPLPLLHVDTTWKFREMIAFRDRVVSTCSRGSGGGAG